MSAVSAPKDQGSGKCREACLRSIEALGLEFIDLYLIHWPGAQGLKPGDQRNRELRQQSWSDVEKLYEQGRYLAAFSHTSSSDLCIQYVFAKNGLVM